MRFDFSFSFATRSRNWQWGEKTAAAELPSPLPAHPESEQAKPISLALPSSFPQVFITEAAFLRNLIPVLTADANEEMYFLTGPKVGPLRVVSRWAGRASLERQSPVFVRASARSVADVLIPIVEQGAELHVIAHSHPGTGPGATTPSGTDMACLGKLQKNGSPAIGCIVTRDNHVRFFSVSTNFHVMLLGTGVTEVSTNVYRLAP